MLDKDGQVHHRYAGNQELYFVGRYGQVYHAYSAPGAGTGRSAWNSLGGRTRSSATSSSSRPLLQTNPRCLCRGRDIPKQGDSRLGCRLDGLDSLSSTHATLLDTVRRRR